MKAWEWNKWNTNSQKSPLTTVYRANNHLSLSILIS